MHPHISIRPATQEDAPGISALVLSLARHFLLNPDGRGAEDFLQTLQPSAVAARLSATAFTTWVASADESGGRGTAPATIAGVVVVRGAHHLFHLFVGEPFQRQGLARRLWLHALSHMEAPARITVNATPFARGFYERMGFVASGPAVQTAGIAFVPMVREAAAG